MQPPAQELVARDLHDNVWTFRHIYRGRFDVAAILIFLHVLNNHLPQPTQRHAHMGNNISSFIMLCYLLFPSLCLL